MFCFVLFLPNSFKSLSRYLGFFFSFLFNHFDEQLVRGIAFDDDDDDDDYIVLRQTHRLARYSL